MYRVVLGTNNELIKHAKVWTDKVIYLPSLGMFALMIEDPRSVVLCNYGAADIVCMGCDIPSPTVDDILNAIDLDDESGLIKESKQFIGCNFLVRVILTNERREMKRLVIQAMDVKSFVVVGKAIPGVFTKTNQCLVVIYLLIKQLVGDDIAPTIMLSVLETSLREPVELSDAVQPFHRS